jgi:hypothetical protein
MLPHTYVALFAAPLTVIITLGTSGVTNQSAAFDPHPDTLFVMSRGRENGFNKAYPYRKQAQVQYINLV